MIKPIQYLRALAALSVVWYHANLEYGGTPFNGAGVDVFFVISGFIMVYTTKSSAWEFAKNRLIRVVPLYWLATVLLLALCALGLFHTIQVTPMRIIKSFLFIPYAGGPVLNPGWTLSYEMAFYAIFAFSLLVKRSLPVMLAIMAACSIGDQLFVEFIAGALIAALMPHVRIGLIVSSMMLIFGLYVLTVWPGVGAALIVSGALNERLLKVHSSVGLMLGNASYSIYLLHAFPLAVMHKLKVPHEIFTVTLIVASSVLGVLSFQYAEKPMSKWLKSIFFLDSKHKQSPFEKYERYCVGCGARLNHMQLKTGLCHACYAW
jgi:exopolysaccharide production protein ExoZ